MIAGASALGSWSCQISLSAGQIAVQRGRDCSKVPRSSSDPMAAGLAGFRDEIEWQIRDHAGRQARLTSG
jgi:hypothetical protein